MSQRRSGTTLCAIAAALTLAGCASSASSTPGEKTSVAPSSSVVAPKAREADAGAAADMPVFSTVAGLWRASDVVVSARIGAVIGKELDDPEKLPGEPALPVALTAATVDQVFTGDVDPGQSLALLTFDGPVTGSVEDLAVVESGQQVLLFLSFSPDGAPGVDTVPSFYGPVAGNQGVFDLRSGRALARSPSVRSFDGEPDPRLLGTRLQITLDQLGGLAIKP